MKYKLRSYLPLPNDATGEGGGISPDPTSPTTPVNTQPGEDLTGLKSALSKERDRASTFERQLKQLQESVKGIDPEKYKQFEQLQEQAEKWNQKEVEIRNGVEQEWTLKVQSEQKKVADLVAELQGLKLRTQAEKAYQSANGRSGGGEDGTTFFDAFYTNIQRSLKLSDKGELEVIDGNGVRLFSKKDATKPMSPAEYFSGLITHPVYGTYFLPQQPGKGGGAQPSTSVNVPADLSSLPRAERLTLLRQQQQR